MDTYERKVSWFERVEELINMLEGSTIGELELTEAGTEIIIRRQPGMVMVSAPPHYSSTGEIAVVPVMPGVVGHGEKEDASVAIIAPLTGVYYSAPSPAAPPFVSVGDVAQVGQVIALIESMKVFNEIQSEVSGRVISLVAPNGEVVEKGDVLLRILPS